MVSYITWSDFTSCTDLWVLILIVVEDGLVPSQRSMQRVSLLRLNPYCSGRWPRTIVLIVILGWVILVLILIVVEDGLVLI